jgi:hypothetical protein
MNIHHLYHTSCVIDYPPTFLTDILCSVIAFLNRAVYEVMWKNMVESERPEMTICRMQIVGWITDATNRHSEYVYVLFFHCNNGCKNAPHS